MSTETTWTPGPWKRKGYTVVTEKGEHLFEVFPPADPTPAEEAQAKADAQVAAAAPTMYEAHLKSRRIIAAAIKALARFPGVDPMIASSLLDAGVSINAALAAADGREMP